jgi:hypothetical protein
LKQKYHLLIGGTADADLFLAPTLVAQVVFQQQALNRAEDTKMEQPSFKTYASVHIRLQITLFTFPNRNGCNQEHIK